MCRDAKASNKFELWAVLTLLRWVRNPETSPGLVGGHGSHHRSPHLFKTVFSVYSHKMTDQDCGHGCKPAGQVWLKPIDFLHLNIRTRVWSEFVHHFPTCVGSACSNAAVWLTSPPHPPEVSLHEMKLQFQCVHDDTGGAEWPDGAAWMSLWTF